MIFRRAVILSLILCLTLAFLPMPASASAEIANGACGENLTWVLTDDGTLTISGTGPMENYSYEALPTTPWSDYIHTMDIRKVIVEEGVTTIGSGAFLHCSVLEEASLPSTLTEIGAGAFKSTALRTVVLPEGLKTIGDYAFQSAVLQELTIPAGVKQIGIAAFASASLRAVSVAEDNPYYCSDENNALFDKGMTTLLQWPCGSGRTVCELPESVTTIGEYAFAGDYTLQSVSLPGVTRICGYSFSGSNITEFHFGSQDIVFDSYAFSGCRFQQFQIPDNVVSMGSHVFSGCYNLHTVIIGSGITTIPEHAFVGTSLREVTCPDNVASIEKNAFSYCTTLWRIELSENLKSIGDSAFRGTGLDEVYIPDSVETIGTYAFADCRNLLSASLGSGLTAIENYLFYASENLNYIRIADGPASIGTSAFAGTSLVSVDIPESVTEIKTSAFQDCASLTTVSLGGSPVSIKGSVFQDCIHLADVTLKSGVNYIGNYAFSGCADLAEIQIPESVTYIGQYSFAGTGLKEIAIPDGVEILASDAFNGCTYLTKVTIGSGIRQFSDFVFSNCDDLNEITFTGDAPGYIYSYAFCGNTVTAYYPAGNETWTEDNRLDYDGTVTWIAMYEVLEGNNSQWGGDAGETVTVRVDGDISKFLELRINGEPVDEDNYTLAEGSTIVTLKPEYLATLVPGKYSLTMVFTDSKAISTFTVVLPFVPGDINSDGSINILDANLAVSHYNEVIDLSESRLRAADVNGDGRIDLFDASLIAAYYNKYIDTFPVET